MDGFCFEYCFEFGSRSACIPLFCTRWSGIISQGMLCLFCWIPVGWRVVLIASWRLIKNLSQWIGLRRSIGGLVLGPNCFMRSMALGLAVDEHSSCVQVKRFGAGVWSHCGIPAPLGSLGSGSGALGSMATCFDWSRPALGWVGLTIPWLGDLWTFWNPPFGGCFISNFVSLGSCICLLLQWFFILPSCF